MNKMPDFKEIVNKAILEYTSKEYIGDGLTANAIRYAFSTGGKRVRSSLLLACLYDFTGSYLEGLEAAIALESVHTYSLIHDDLPAMDNDDYRRNMLTVHKKFREDIAILAGDALLTYAFELLNRKPSIISSKLTKLLAINAGSLGMVYGQELDLLNEGKKIDFDTLKNIHTHKTGNLLACPFLMACVLANREELMSKFSIIGYKLGLAFQIQDDILDVTKNLKKEGQISSDITNDKVTYLTFMSIDEAKIEAKELYEEVITELKSLFNKNELYTVELLESLIDRGI